MRTRPKRTACWAHRAHGDRPLRRSSAQLGARLARVPATRVDGLTLEGEALAATGQYDAAIARWQDAIGHGQVGVARRARALASQWLARLGRRQEAEDLAQPLVDEYNDAQQEAETHPDTPGHLNPRTQVLHDAAALAYLGMAMETLGFAQDANQAFDESEHADPHRVETLLESAELFLSKEDMGHAGEVLREAMAVNAHSPRALVLRGRTRLMNDLDFSHSLEDVEAAEHVNPHLPEASVLRAEIILHDGDIAGADHLVDQALAINPHCLEALAMRGAIRFEANDMDGFHRAFDALFAVSPVDVDAYAMVADFADWDHRYTEAIAIMREGLNRPAVAADPRLQGTAACTARDQIPLRTGAEEEGLHELQESFRTDRYNVRVYNLLNLYEDTIAHQYTTDRAGPFLIRYQNDERPVMSRYVPQLLQRAYNDMVARYHFTPEGPISVEMYADTEQFSVRTSGLPEIGVQGVCFGKVITAISPAGGPFNWGQIVWHELAHVFAIQISHSRVPRWFTEGLSEWEAFHSHPEWSREDDPSLYRAMLGHRVPRVAEFNTAFTHARSGDDMLVAYYAASKLVEFIINQYGLPARRQSAAAVGPRPLTTPDVIQRGLGVAPDALDQSFRTFTLQRLSRYQNQFTVDPGDFSNREALSTAATQHPTDADALARAAAAELAAGEASPAEQRATAALAINASQPIAHWVLATIALHGHDGAAALPHVDAILAGHHDGYDLRVMEARAARAAHNDATPDNRAFLKLRPAKIPPRVDAWQLLAEIHEHAHATADELRELREVVRLDQHNRPALRKLLGATCVAQSAWNDIRAARPTTHVCSTPRKPERTSPSPARLPPREHATMPSTNTRAPCYFIRRTWVRSSSRLQPCIKPQETECARRLPSGQRFKRPRTTLLHRDWHGSSGYTEAA